MQSSVLIWQLVSTCLSKRDNAMKTRYIRWEFVTTKITCTFVIFEVYWLDFQIKTKTHSKWKASWLPLPLHLLQPSASLQSKEVRKLTVSFSIQFFIQLLWKSSYKSLVDDVTVWWTDKEPSIPSTSGKIWPTTILSRVRQ